MFALQQQNQKLIGLYKLKFAIESFLELVNQREATYIEMQNSVRDIASDMFFESD